MSRTDLQRLLQNRAWREHIPLAEMREVYEAARALRGRLETPAGLAQCSCELR